MSIDLQKLWKLFKHNEVYSENVVKHRPNCTFVSELDIHASQALNSSLIMELHLWVNKDVSLRYLDAVGYTALCICSGTFHTNIVASLYKTSLKPSEATTRTRISLNHSFYVLYQPLISRSIYCSVLSILLYTSVGFIDNIML